MGQPRAKAPRLDLSSYDMAFKLLVSPHAAGKIIGRGGAEIANLRKELGVGCHIHGQENLFPRTNLQVAVLFGNQDSINLAFESVVAKLAGAEAEADQQGALTVPVVMTKNAVSMLIGTKGATIAGLRQESGCQFAAEKESILGEQVVRVSGTLEFLPAALALMTPLVERSGDSIAHAMQEYGAGWGDEWAPPPHMVAPKGAGKGFGSPKGKSKGGGGGNWLAPATRAIASEPWKGSSPKGSAKGASKGYWTRPKGGGSWAAIATGNGWHQELAGGELDSPFAERYAVGEVIGERVGTIGAPGGDGEIADEQFSEGDDDAEADPHVMNSPCTIAFAIPAETIGRVLGKGGASSAEIRRTTGVALQIDPTPAGAAEGTVTLKGSLNQVHRAHKMVVGRVLSKY